MSTGIVKWFNDAKGYGFINPDDGGEDLFADSGDDDLLLAFRQFAKGPTEKAGAGGTAVE